MEHNNWLTSECNTLPRATESNQRPIRRGDNGAINRNLIISAVRTSMVRVAIIPMKTLRKLRTDIDNQPRASVEKGLIIVIPRGPRTHTPESAVRKSAVRPDYGRAQVQL